MGATLIQAILDNLYKLWPYRIVDVDEKAVRFTFGRPKALEGGDGYWFCPGLQSIEKTVVVYQEVDCQVQSMETADDISVTFSANVGYTIADVVKWRTQVHDFDSTLERAARGLLGEIVERSRFAELRAGRTKLANATKRELKKLVEPWGVEIVSVRLTDFVRTKQYRLFGGVGL